ncbi:HEPN domain-containing protein [Phyllobacterium sp. LjRoot231]|uniref:HEPN domain-containing protein n=1 Tax=Phyllobacterium sp. LjRoot231 TaxID=3342289 RepID=UPI003ECE2984
MTLSRGDLQEIAQTKLDDAVLLFEHERFSNSYYLFGYAAEIALKACIARSFSPETIPDKRFVNEIYSHDLDRLMRLAKLNVVLEDERNLRPRFGTHWSAVSEWSEETRYDTIDVFRATDMRRAMLDQDDGVFQWLQKHW